jgi:uncharacterized protein
MIDVRTRQASPPSRESRSRLDSLDALRGFALVGILFINITAMGGPIDSRHPASVPDLADPDWLTWLFGEVFVNGAMRGIFSLLFGASALLFLESSASRPAMFARRSFWLLIFGVINSTLLLWPGDILLIYALASPIILLNLRSSLLRLLIVSGLILLGLSVWSYFLAESGEISGIVPGLAAEQSARLGGYGDNLAFMWRTALEWTFTPGVLWWVADAAAFMLVGMALYRLGVFSPSASSVGHWFLFAVGFGAGLPLRAAQAALAFSSGGEPPAMAEAFFQAGRLAMSLGWVGGFLLAWRHLPPLAARPLEALGRMALSGYLLQSLVAALLFSGFGLGLWNRLGWMQLWALVPLIMTCMAILHLLWLSSFHMGPVEWLWRFLTFGEAPKLRRRRRSAR